MTDASTADATTVAIRGLRDDDVPTADHVMRVAFGTFLGLPEPEQFLGDASYVRPRARLLADSAWIAERDGELVGSTFATRWGSFGFFGPLSVHPELWDTGIGRRLMDPVQEAFERWGVRHAGLFTWPHSPKHLALYQRYGFWPHALTTVMARSLTPERSASAPPDLLSEHHAHGLEIARDVSAAVHDGLDLSEEAAATVRHRLGDVVLTDGGFAVCQHGAQTEGGSGTLYVKFAAVAPGPEANSRFAALLDACEAYGRQIGAAAVIAGVSTARHEAYRALLDRGYRVEIQGLAMHRDADALWSRPGCWVLDDWR